VINVVGGGWLENRHILPKVQAREARMGMQWKRRKCCFGIGRLREDLGHSDKHGKKKVEEKKEDESAVKTQADVSARTNKPAETEQADVKRNPDGTVCEDCR
jgi:hypothetical protein